MDSQHVKSINTDKRSKKRIRFASNRERSKRASADVYRSYKRKIGVTSAATREEFVHNPHGNERAKKRQRAHHLPIDDQSARTAVLKISKVVDEDESDSEIELEVSSSFASELDVALDRNASEIFGKFHRKVWVLVRSLPEILHHVEEIIGLLMSYMLSPVLLPERPSDLDEITSSSSIRKEYIINHATTDILHLLTVLARDIRHEIHGYLHTRILPRIIQDLLNRPPPPPESGKQPIPLDVTIVEAAFRTLSYIFRYDSDLVVEDMEPMRKYYGSTLGHRRELVRRLASETFAPLIRKVKSQSSRQRHLRRVLRALASTEDQPVTSSLKRSQSDAVDGISQFIYQIARGVPGRLHSQGYQILRFLLAFCTGGSVDSIKQEKHSGSRLVLSVASQSLERICHHMNEKNMVIVINELFISLRSCLSMLTSDEEIDCSSAKATQPAVHMLDLIAQVASFREGSLLQGLNEQQLKELFDSMELLFSEKCFGEMPDYQRRKVLSSSCAIWIVLQTKQRSSDRLERCLRGIFNSSDDRQSTEATESIRLEATVLSSELLPHLSERSAVDIVGVAILKAAARIAQHDNISSLMMIFSVATRRLDVSFFANDAVDGNTHDRLFFPRSGASYNISNEDKELLKKSCLLDIQNKTISGDLVAQLGVALRCAPFLTLLGLDNGRDTDLKSNYKSTSKWTIKIMKALNSETEKPREAISEEDVVIVKALALEAFSCLSFECLESSLEVSLIEKMVRQMKPYAEGLLFSHARSLWAMRGLASFVRISTKLNHGVSDRIDDVFDALVANLRSSSHSLRSNTLEILASFPNKAFVTDHADLELQDDLDEEPSFQPKDEAKTKSTGPVGLCGIIKTMERLESTPVRLSNERVLLSLVSRIDVLGRTGKLPVIYAEAAANHMLGCFYVKFTPMWPTIARTLVSLAIAYENAVWPCLEAKLVSSIQRKSISSEEDDNGNFREEKEIDSCLVHHAACLKWQESFGEDLTLFRGSSGPETEGEVPRHLMTDEETVMESIWSVAEQGQRLVAKHSRVIVPLFVDFLHNQYYRFHSNDPDARELKLNEHVDAKW